jgi:PAS domain S-box-containing protein
MTPGATSRFLFVALMVITLAPAASALEKVTLQLNWKHQFQFAGYYAALDQGYFRAAGFAVELRELPDGGDPVAAVLGGQADYGIAASELALHRGQGKPVVALAVIVQHSPLVLLANRRRVPTIEALADSRIMLLPHETELLAYLKRQGITRHEAVPHSFNPADLIEGRVDAISGYSTDEPFLLRQGGFPYVAFSPKEAGIDFYGDTLFTTAGRVQARPAAVAAFRAAALRGWVYAMAHPEEIADLILRRYSQRHSREHLLFEAAEMRRLMQPDLVDIGQMSDARWQRIALTYAEVGMLPADFSLAGLVWGEEQRRLPAWVWTALALTGLLLLMVTTSAAHYARLSRRLTAEMKSRAAAEAALRSSEERYRRLAEQSKDVIWTVDLETLSYTYVSPAIESARGYTPAEVIGQPIADSLSPESCERVMTMLADHRQRLAAGDATAISGMAEIEQWHKDGSLVMAEVMASFLLDDAGQPVAVLGISRSNAERRAAEAQLLAINERQRQQLDEIRQLQEALQEQAVRDSLTGCFNRRYLDETLERELWRARREGYPLAVVILDLDHFKQINDTYGHLAGDEVLRVLAEYSSRP